MNRYGVLIPAYQPDHHLPALVKELLAAGFEVIVVNDGSTSGTGYFADLQRNGVVVLSHEENRGKGRALKTGISHMAKAGFSGVITADADGQHAVEDIRQVAEKMKEHPGALVMGARDFSQMVPRSRAGNSMTCRLFSILYGVHLKDTQTGLRGIPISNRISERLLQLPGERYEYEMAMLIHSNAIFPEGIVEIPIQTIYIDNNQSSHFRPLRDGAKIYAVLFRHLPGFLVSSLLAFGVDYALFNLLYYLLHFLTTPATVLARIVSCTVNYNFNRRFVFRDSNKHYNARNYFLLAAGILLMNCVLMYLLVELCHLPAFAGKLLVECLLYLVSFTVQNKLAAKKD